MSVLFARAVVVPVWMIVVALITVLAPAGGPRLRDLLLILGLALVASALLALVASVIRALVPRARTRHAPGVDVLPAIDVEPLTGPYHGDGIVALRRSSGAGRGASVVPLTRRSLALMFSAGVRVWRVEGETAALAGRTRAASDARGRTGIDNDRG